MGALLVLFFSSMRLWFKDFRFRMSWWKWLLFSAWFLGVYVVIAGGFTLIGENEVRAGTFFLGIFGTAFFVLGVGLFRLLRG